MLKSKLRLILSELSQLITTFSYCFENELVAWCNKPTPILNDFGPAFKKVYILLQQFTKVCLFISNASTQTVLRVSSEPTFNICMQNLGCPRWVVTEIYVMKVRTNMATIPWGKSENNSGLVLDRWKFQFCTFKLVELGA